MKGQTANRECLKHPCKGWSYYEAACSLNCSCLGNFDSPGKGGAAFVCERDFVRFCGGPVP